MNHTTVSDAGTAVIVDDHALSLAFSSTAARRLGYQVHAFSDPCAALRETAALKPVLLVVDVNLPVLDGLSLLLGLRSDWPAGLDWPRVVVLSAEDLPAAHPGAGLADCFLRKPLPADCLRRALAPAAGPDPLAMPAGDAAGVLRQRFRTELQRDLARIDGCLAGQDLQAAADILHRLLGAAAMAGEKELSERLRALLDICRRSAEPARLMRLYYDVLTVAEPCLPGRERN